MKFDKKTIELKGERFTINELSARNRQAIFKMFKKEDIDAVELQAHYIKLGCTEFKDSTLDDIMELPGTVFGKLADEVVQVSGLSDEADTTKNS